MNPELRRNAWIELSAHRLILMPVMVILVLALIGAQSTDPWRLVAKSAGWIFILVVHFWGTRQAAEAVTDEVRDRTWDWQRLSSLSAWQMAWGKLFGATAYAWYGGAWCLVALAVARAMSGAGADFASMAVTLVASAVALHGAGLAGSLQAGRKDSRLGARMGILVLIPLALLFTGVAPVWDRLPGTYTWFGMAFDAVRFVAASAVAFAAWGVLAVDREMSRELRVRKVPWAYPAFAVFLGAYASGFFPLDAGGHVELFVWLTFLAALSLAYYGLFADVTTATIIRRVVLHLRTGEYARALDEAPQWTVALALAALFAAIAACLPSLSDNSAMASVRRWLAVFPLATLLAGVRDAGLLVFFALAPRPRRVEGTTLLYLVLLWWVVPGLLMAMGFDSAAALLSAGGLSGTASMIVMALEVGLVGAGIAWRWRRLAFALDRDPRKAVAGGV